MPKAMPDRLARSAPSFPLSTGAIRRIARDIVNFVNFTLLGLALLIAAEPAAAQQRAEAPLATPRALAGQVEERNLRALVEKLVSFGTRHTLSSQSDKKRGIGASLR